LFQILQAHLIVIVTINTINTNWKQQRWIVRIGRKRKQLLQLTQREQIEHMVDTVVHPTSCTVELEQHVVERVDLSVSILWHVEVFQNIFSGG
jgi:hypothetical protein